MASFVLAALILTGSVSFVFTFLSPSKSRGFYIARVLMFDVSVWAIVGVYCLIQLL